MPSSRGSTPCRSRRCGEWGSSSVTGCVASDSKPWGISRASRAGRWNVQSATRRADTFTRSPAGSTIGRTVVAKVRFSNFKTITRSKTLPHEVDTAAEIYAVVRDLYLKLDPDRPRIRLLGVAVTGLSPGPPARQL